MINEIAASSSGQAITAAPNAMSATPAILATISPCFQLDEEEREDAGRLEPTLIGHDLPAGSEPPG